MENMAFTTCGQHFTYNHNGCKIPQRKPDKHQTIKQSQEAENT